MKKILAVILALTVSLSFFGCNKKDGDNGSAAPTETVQLSEQPTAATDPKVAEFFELVKPEFEKTKAAMSEQNMVTFDYYTEQDNIIMEYKYTVEAASDVDSTKSALDASGETYSYIYKQFSNYVGRDDVALIIRYLAHDGSKLFDYVVDKDYSPENAGSAPAPGSFANLNEFVESDYFKSLLASGNNEMVRTSAQTEDDNTLVLIYTVLTPMDETQRNEFTETWLNQMEASGADIDSVYQVTVKTFVNGIGDDLNIIHRAVTEDGTVIAEYNGSNR